MIIPKAIQSAIDDSKCSIDNIGMSDSTVVIFDQQVLKIQALGKESETEYAMLKWLNGQLPVPKIQAFIEENQKSYLLMSKIPGFMACTDGYKVNPEKLTTLLAKALKKLWEVDIQSCPCDQQLEKKLEQAQFNVENHLVDMENVEAETFGASGFKDPADLLKWLIANKPEEDFVLSHGDFCLPNIFFEADEIKGYIDLGRAGKADKWQDIALCYRSLRDNLEGKRASSSQVKYDAKKLFDKLDIEPDWEKIKYYILLDELF